MKPQPQGHAMDNSYHPDDIKPDAMLVNETRSLSQSQDGDNMSYSEKKALKQLAEASGCPKFSDYWITARLNTALKGHASIWYTEMKEIHGRRNWRWWKSQIIQKYRNGTWIWQKTMLFENDKYSVDKDPYEWCLRQSKRLKAIDPQMNIQMRNHKAGRTRTCSNQNFTLDDIANTLQDVSIRANIGKYSSYKSSGLKEKQPFRVEFIDKPKERVAEVTKKKDSCHNCGSADQYSNNCSKAKKKVYTIEKVPEEESPTE
ncbi:hypothetical protein O181_023114 [Austropuccinia psidii MF-1]|uniref:Uncharacterized protein n=1 Tax=Austropuccinia psidii MF-1 TaxID=1389203 RepID=A0A9Q3GYC5_9BASI|nr:hypothetical protein [Austropuccinia psidii MF-1]